MNQDQMESVEVEVYDPVKCHYRILVPEDSESNDINENKTEIILEEAPPENFTKITVWTQHETLALINIFSLYKDQFKDFKKKKGQWELVSKKLAKIGICKAPEKCEIKWKNLLRVYRQHKFENKGPGKFEFFNELDNIIANDPQYKHVTWNYNLKKPDDSFHENAKEELSGKKKKCSCVKSEKHKRHDDRMALMEKKLEIEERKVRAFEDYLRFLKSNSKNI